MANDGKPTPKPLEGRINVYDMWNRPPKGRVLLVEPNEDAARVLEVRLARDGHEVFVCTKGSDALSAVDEEVIDVAIVDRGLADVDCIDFVKKVLASSEVIEVIVMAIDPTVETSVEALDAGAFDVVAKPFSNLKLVTSKIENAVGKVRAERDRAELARVLYEQTQDLAERETEAELSKSSDALPQLDEDGEAIDLDNMAGVDPLTGIPNRRSAEQRFKSETARALRYDRPLTVAMASVDGLSSLIETGGAAVADGVLRGMVQLFTTMVRDVDFVARLQGGEFFFLLPETPKENGTIVFDRIRQKIAQTSFADFVADGKSEIQLTICFGVAGLPTDTMNADILRRATETALERAKVTGDVVVGFEPDMISPQ